MIGEAVRRCLRYAIGTCVGLSALVYILDPATLSNLPRPSPVPGGSATAPSQAVTPRAAPPTAKAKPAPKPLTIRAPAGVVLVAFAPPALGDALQAAAKEFRGRHGGSGVLLELGATSEHVEVLRGGRYADLVLGAGEDSLAPLLAAGRIRAPRPFARVPLALAVPRANPARISQLSDLAAPGRKLAVAAPSTPVGALTRRALESVSPELGPGVMANVVAQLDDPSEVLTHLGLSRVDAGFVLRSQLAGHFGKQLVEIPLPPEARPATSYQVAILPTSERLPFTEAFVAFLESSAGRRILASYGVDPPPSS
jgi:molybdate transport system substrate-binding protein